MKAIIVLIAGVVLAGAAFAAPQNKTYTGEIMDSACASSGSHAGMTKNDPKMTAKDCTTVCVGHGAKYVLYDSAKKATYMLDDQKKPAAFAGQKVVVSGTFDDTTKTIKVADIKAAS